MREAQPVSQADMQASRPKREREREREGERGKSVGACGDAGICGACAPASAGWVPPLDHEVLDNAVERHPVVVSAVDKLQEVPTPAIDAQNLVHSGATNEWAHQPASARTGMAAQAEGERVAPARLWGVLPVELHAEGPHARLDLDSRLRHGAALPQGKRGRLVSSTRRLASPSGVRRPPCSAGKGERAWRRGAARCAQQPATAHAAAAMRGRRRRRDSDLLRMRPSLDSQAGHFAILVGYKSHAAAACWPARISRIQ
jgi:hypothetical protein